MDIILYYFFYITILFYLFPGKILIHVKSTHKTKKKNSGINYNENISKDIIENKYFLPWNKKANSYKGIKLEIYLVIRKIEKEYS